MNVARMRTPGYFSHEFVGLKHTLFTANSPATGTDGVWQDGTGLDRQSIVPQFFSVKAVAGFTVAGLGGGDTVKAKFRLMDSADGSTWGNAVESAEITYSANGDFVQSANFDIGGMRRHLRLSAMCTFDAAATDTVDMTCQLVAGALDELPVT